MAGQPKSSLAKTLLMKKKKKKKKKGRKTKKKKQNDHGADDDDTDCSIIVNVDEDHDNIDDVSYDSEESFMELPLETIPEVEEGWQRDG